MKSKSVDRPAGIGGASFVAMLGGAAAVAGSFLSWISVGVPRLAPGRELSVDGLSLIPGKLALSGGIVLILSGAAMWITGSPELRRWMAVLAVVAGSLVAGAAIAAFQSEIRALLQEALGGALRQVRETGPPGLFRRRFADLTDFGPSRGPGVYLALTGGIVAAAGGIAGVFWTAAPASAPPASASPAEIEATEPLSKENAT